MEEKMLGEIKWKGEESGGYHCEGSETERGRRWNAEVS